MCSTTVRYLPDCSLGVWDCFVRCISVYRARGFAILEFGGVDRISRSVTTRGGEPPVRPRNRGCSAHGRRAASFQKGLGLERASRSTCSKVKRRPRARAGDGGSYRKGRDNSF